MAMVAAIALTAGLVLVFGEAKTRQPDPTVNMVGAAELAQLRSAVPSSTPASSTSQPGSETTIEDFIEILGSVYDGVNTTTTVETTTTTTPPQVSTTRPRSTTTTTRPRATTTTTRVPATTTTTAPGSFQPDLAAEFLAAINNYRASQGLAPLQRESSLDTRARDWSKRMADRNKLSHSNLSSLLPPWSAASENVGRGGSVESLFEALKNSSGHRANMLGDFTHIGVGVWRSGNGTLWTTHIFVR